MSSDGSVEILALDPGETTGIAKRQLDGRWVTTTERSKAALYEMICELNPGVVVCESFDTQARLNTHSKYTIQLIGGIEAICMSRGIKLIFQRPGHRYPCLGESQLLHEERGWPFVIHQVDAFAHLLRHEERKAR